MIAALAGRLDDIAGDAAIRAVILRGAGRAFSAGHDLREITQMRQAEDGGEAAFSTLFDHCTGMMAAIRALPQPVIAQVHGIATAAGCQLVATCDMAVAASDTRFGVNGVNIGLFCTTPTVALSRNVARKHAFEMMTTGDLIGADRACEIGLVNRVVPADTLAAEAAALADVVARKLGAAVRIGKQAFYRQIEMPVADAYALAGRAMVENLMNPDTAEGIAAFLERREPGWRQ